MIKAKSLFGGVVVISLGAFAAPEGSSLNWKGDFRFRNEYISSESSTPEDYFRQRIYLRVGALAILDEANEVDFRLTTGPGRTSVNQTLGEGDSGSTANGFYNYSIGLDRAYLRNTSLSNLSIYAGRMKNIFWMPGGSDLVWDPDLNFDGAAVSADMENDYFDAFLRASYNWVGAVYGGQRALNLSMAQSGFNSGSEDFSWGVSVAYYYYTNLSGRSVLDSSGKGNSTQMVGTSTQYIHNYQLVNPGFQIGFGLVGVPFEVFGDYVQNMTMSEGNKGFLAGIKIGKAKDAGDFLFLYDYRKYEKDSTLGSFVESNSLLGAGTDGDSHRLRVSYRATNKISITATGYFGELESSKKRREKGQLDFVYRFM